MSLYSDLNEVLTPYATKIKGLTAANEELKADLVETENELKSTLDQAIEDFAVPTQEAVDNWLTAHPEATTTVQDGSLTEAKFSDALKLKTINSYVTPEMFGAKGDGEADDSDAFQMAVNSVGANNTLFLKGTYRITKTIEINTLPLRMTGGKIYFGIANGQAAFHGTHNVGNTYPTSIYFNNVEIEAPGALVFDLQLYNSKMIACKVHRAETVFNHVTGTTHIIGCRFGAIRNAFIDVTQDSSHGFADSTVTDCYINGNDNYDNVTIIKGVIDYDIIFSNCFFDYFKYVCSQGRACEFNNCVFNRCYSFYPFNDISATYVYPITASFVGCIFEFNTESHLRDLGWAENITEYLGFIVIKKGYIGNLRIIDPTEIDTNYNTLYIVDTVGAKIALLDRQKSRITVQNVLYKNVLFTGNDLHYFCYKEIPNVIHSQNNSLIWKDGPHNLMDCFDGAIVIHPSGNVVLCVGYDTDNGTPIGATLYSAPVGD